jgi:Uma2 family endonuclease
MPPETIVNKIPQVLPAELHPNVDHLVTDDDTPVDNVFSEKQQRLLTEPLYSSWTGPGGGSFVAMANVGLYYALRTPPLVPDALLSLDVEVPADLWEKPHRCYFVWEYGKRPDVVIEVVSNLEGGEDSDKLLGYARAGVPYYVIFDPEQLLSRAVLRAYKLEGRKYREFGEPIWLADVGLGLQLWHGSFEGHDNTWLRWVDADGELIKTGSERAALEQERADSEKERAELEKGRADQQKDRADREKDRADREKDRADRLAAQLRRLGVEPEEQGDDLSA